MKGRRENGEAVNLEGVVNPGGCSTCDYESLSDQHLYTGAQAACCCLTGETVLVDPAASYQGLPRNGGEGLTGGALL